MSKAIVQLSIPQKRQIVARSARSAPPDRHVRHVDAHRRRGPRNLLDRILLEAVNRYMENITERRSLRPTGVDVRA
jgi:hypothetical protein